eukprot:8895160-Alexandrium_andersonii.AAC.1
MCIRDSKKHLRCTPEASYLWGVRTAGGPAKRPGWRRAGNRSKQMQTALERCPTFAAPQFG